MRKTTGDIFTLHLCNTNSHMMYGSRYKRDRQNFLKFWTNFCPFNPENQNFEKMKKTPRDIILYRKARDIIFSHVGPFFIVLPT